MECLWLIPHGNRLKRNSDNFEGFSGYHRVVDLDVEGTVYMFEERNQRIWEKIKPMGMKSYLIRSGVLRTGLIFFILLGFISPLIDHGFSAYYFQSDGFRNRLIILGTIAPLYGVIMAYSSWKSLEKKYK